MKDDLELSGYPRSVEPQSGGTQRNYGGWVALLIMFSLLLFGQVSNSFRNADSAKIAGFEDQLKTIVRQEVQSKTDPKLTGAFHEPSPAQQLRDLETDLGQQKKLDDYGRAILAATLTEEKKSVPASLYQPLEQGKMDSTRAIGQGESSSTLTRAQAEALSKRMLTSDLFVAKLAAVQTLEKAGDKTARTRLITRTPEFIMQGLTVCGLTLVGASVFVWFGYFAARSSGEMQPLGLKNGSISAFQADRLAVRAAQLIGGFLIVDLIGELTIGDGMMNPGPMIVQGLAILAMVFALAKLPLDGVRIDLASLGISREHLGRHIAMGVAGFVAELPVALAVLGFMTGIFKSLPTPDHPASQALEQNHHLMAVAAILFTGTVVAAFWEEIMFRGLLFPAMSRVMKSVPLGALASSFLFASIHPQGLAMWPSLCVVGLMSCMLSYQSRSLVPSIVMHFCHNASLMVLTVLIS